jgi:hypothetical protein
MTQTDKKRVPLTEREKLEAGFYVPFFAPKRGKNCEGSWFTPHFPSPEGAGLKTTKRRTEQPR